MFWHLGAMDNLAQNSPALTLGQSEHWHRRSDVNWPAWPWALLAVMAIIDLIWLVLSPAILTNYSWVYICAVLAIANIAVWLTRFYGRHDLPYVLLMGFAFTACAWPVLRLFNYLSMNHCPALGRPPAQPLGQPDRL